MPSTIEWTDETWNPVTGCSRVSPGCDNCYMFALYPRLRAMAVPGYDTAPDSVQMLPERLEARCRGAAPGACSLTACRTCFTRTSSTTSSRTFST